MASQKTFFPSFQKKFVLVLCVLTWAAIFFISGTLFVRRRYELASKLSSSIQEQIDHLSSQVSEGKSSAKVLTQALHERINQTLSSLDSKITALETEFRQRRQSASQALHALQGQTTSMAKAKIDSRAVERGTVQLKSSVTGLCVDSMEKAAGSDVELYSCHGQGRNQAWRYSESNNLIENKAINMCLRAADTNPPNDGSPVKTAACYENDTRQKWKRSWLLFILDDGSQEIRCLDVDHAENKLVLKSCNSSKNSQHWTY